MPKPELRISVVTVTYRQGEGVRAALAALGRELREDDELIVVDNASGDSTPEVVLEAAPRAALIRSPENSGFPAACNRGAQQARGELLVFLNPDAVVEPGWRDAIARPLGDGSGWDAWQALVTAEAGRVVNTRGGILHFTGIAWAGGAGEPLVERRATDGPNGGSGAPAGETAEPTDPGFCSGACFAISREHFERLGGFAPDFFLYHEDVDLSLRVRLAGGRLGVASDARVDHEYDFHKGPAKWRYLERNRWATLIRTYPGALLALLAPALLATELALIVVSLAGGWFGEKRRAWADTLRALPRLLAERRGIQRSREIGAGDFARALSARLDSPYLGAARRSAALRWLLDAYWGVVLRLLRAHR